MLTQAPRGTRDMLPQDAYLWHMLEAKMRELAALWGYREIRTPIFEHTELFLRGVGGTTDIVTKEMYTFKDKGDRSITLRPEGTAGAVRAFLEGRLYAEPLPSKVYYLAAPIFRYENPQAGRLREHHQFGMECFGGKEPTVEAELINLLMTLLSSLGLTGLIHIFNPEIVLIGGGVSAQEELLIRPLREKVRKMLMPRFAENLRLEAARLGNDAGMAGALKFWLDQEEAK